MSTGVHLDGKFSVKLGNHFVIGAFFFDNGSDDRLTVWVGDCPFYDFNR